MLNRFAYVEYLITFMAVVKSEVFDQLYTLITLHGSVVQSLSTPYNKFECKKDNKQKTNLSWGKSNYIHLMSHIRSLKNKSFRHIIIVNLHLMNDLLFVNILVRTKHYTSEHCNDLWKMLPKNFYSLWCVFILFIRITKFVFIIYLNNYDTWFILPWLSLNLFIDLINY